MATAISCTCGQLTIELTGQPVSCDSFGGSLKFAEHKQQQNQFSYYKNKDVIGTTGEASCTSFLESSGWQLNRYHCAECNQALFCVLTEADSLTGIAIECQSLPETVTDAGTDKQLQDAS